ncbi:MAG: hypothetical protein GF401_16255 [Chitinivibrionales bacterium]|nr:hypothetical protein [Chitinivibrionales bacterium]
MKFYTGLLKLSPLLAILAGFVVSAQMHGHGRRGHGHGSNGDMDGHCPMCGRAWDGTDYYRPVIPDTLPAPKSELWINRLDKVLARERLSKQQYQKDAEAYAMHMPYNMVIPQEENHIEWISDLYRAFGKQVPDSIPTLVNTTSGRDALRTGMELEQELIPEYEWLIENAENEKVQQILGDILYQTRMHYTMFQHALSMGAMIR